MKKSIMVLPFAVLLAYCSGPNNTQTTAADLNETSVSAGTNSTLANNTATTYDEISTVNATETGSTTVNSRTNKAPLAGNNLALSTNAIIPIDTTDPMYLHWQKTNARFWTWNMDYPGYDRPLAGSYNAAINGDWGLIMTPELATAWKPDNSRSLWLAGTNTYLSASESFNTRNTSVDSNATTVAPTVNSISYNASNGNMYQLPAFNLYLDNGSFTGYTGCNGISGRVTVAGTALHFTNTTPSTHIDCMGGFDENRLVDLLSRVNSYAYVGDELQLLQGNQVLLRFKRNNTDAELK